MNTIQQTRAVNEINNIFEQLGDQMDKFVFGETVAGDDIPDVVLAAAHGERVDEAELAAAMDRHFEKLMGDFSDLDQQTSILSDELRMMLAK